MNYPILSFSLFICLVAGISCAPVTSTRIGPAVPEKSPDCDITMLAPGKVPERPYRDVGMVSLKNCPEYDRGACKKWVVAEACRLGGDVIYLPDGKGKDDRPAHLQGGVTWTLTVAAYFSQLAPTDDDPVLNSTPAKPCDFEEASEDDASDPEDQMCAE